MSIARSILFVAACPVMAVALQAQAPRPSLVGQTVRVSTAQLRSGTQVVILSWDADSLRVDPAGPVEYVAVPWSEVQKVEYKSGRTNSAGKGALIGGIVGGTLGLIADVSCAGAEGWDAMGCPPMGAATVGGAVFWAGVGALIGLAVKRDQWAEARPIPLQVAPTMQDGRPAISMSWRF